MVEFRGIVLKETSAKQEKTGVVKNMDVNITLNKLEEQNQLLLVDFTYKVIYHPGIGDLMFSGTVALTDSKSKLAEYKKQWKKTKVLPQAVMAPLMNLINVTSGVNGVLVSRSINLAPPIVPPKLEITPIKKPKSKKK